MLVEQTGIHDTRSHWGLGHGFRLFQNLYLSFASILKRRRLKSTINLHDSRHTLRVFMGTMATDGTMILGFNGLIHTHLNFPI